MYAPILVLAQSSLIMSNLLLKGEQRSFTSAPLIFSECPFPITHNSLPTGFSRSFMHLTNRDSLAYARYRIKRVFIDQFYSQGRRKSIDGRSPAQFSHFMIPNHCIHSYILNYSVIASSGRT